MARRNPGVGELTRRLSSLVAGSETPWKRVVVAGALGTVALGGLAFGLRRVLDRRDAAARNAAWSELNGCLLGEPLREGETPVSRLGNIELAIRGVPAKKRVKQPGDVAWPGACASYAVALQDHAGGAPLGDAAKALANALKSDASATSDLGPEVERMYREAAALKLEAGRAPDAISAPKPAAPLFSSDAFRALPKFLSGSFSLASVREAPSPGRSLYFLIDQRDMPEGPVLCEATASDTTVRCLKVPAAVATLSPGLRLIGTTEDGARPFYFAGDRGQIGVFPPDGQAAVDAGVTLGGAARVDGSITLLVRRDPDKDVRIVHHAASGHPIERPLLLASDLDPAGQVGLSWDWVVYKGAARSGAPSHLFARKIEGAAGRVKPAVDVGEIDEPAPADKAEREPPIVACRTDVALSARVRGARGDTLALLVGGRWGAPMKLATRGGALTCRGVEAVTTSVEHAVEGDKNFATVSQSRCGSSGCASVAVPLRQLLEGVPEIVPADASGIVAADVGGKLVILWNGGPLGGLRMRFGAPDALMDTADIIVADGREGGANARVSSIVGLKVLAGDGFAVVLVNTTSGVKALRLDALGGVVGVEGVL